MAELEAYRLSDRSTRLRLLPNFLTAFFTGDFERPVFRGLVARVITVPARDTRPILLALHPSGAKPFLMRTRLSRRSVQSFRRCFAERAAAAVQRGRRKLHVSSQATSTSPVHLISPVIDAPRLARHGAALSRTSRTMSHHLANFPQSLRLEERAA